MLKNLSIIATLFLIAIAISFNLVNITSAVTTSSPILNPSADEVETFTNVPRTGSVRVLKTSNEPGESCTLISYEGLGDNTPIPVFDGITSPGWLSLIDVDAGGSGNFANEPSPSTTAYWLGGNSSSRDINFEEPVAKVSFFYASFVNVSLKAYDENGNLIDSATGAANFAQGVGGDPNGSYDKFDPITVSTDSNLIVKVTVSGNVNQTGIDDLTVCRIIGINSVEFTQAIQEWQAIDEFKNDIASDKTPPVPLIANKPLALRIYMEEVDTSTEVTIKLTGLETAEQKVTLQPNCSPEESRSGENGCRSVDFYFTPPNGDWSVNIKVFDGDGNEIESHVFALNSVQTEPLTLNAVSVCDSRSFGLLGEWRCADGNDLGSLIGFLESTAPTHDIVVNYPGHTVRRNTLFYITKSNWWFDIARDIQNLGNEGYFYGMVRPDVPTSIGGIAHDIPGRGAASRTSVIRLTTEANDEVVAHETGHLLGRRHTNTIIPSASGGTPPGCYSTASDSNTDWPYNNNRIQSGPMANPQLEVGFDVTNRQPLDPQNTYDWMSYCVPRWISPHTYRNALSTLQITASAAAAEESVFGTFWQVSGIISDTVLFDPLFEYETTASTDPETGSYRFEVKTGGTILFTRYFTPNELHTESGDPGGDVEAIVFSELIPFQAGASQIVLIDSTETEIGTIEIMGELPSVNITFPTGGETLQGNQAISWEISDLDSTEHISWVQYSPDNGTSWQTFASALVDNSLEVDFDEISGSDDSALIRVFVSDGVNTGTDVTNTFTVPKKTVTTSILFPSSGSAFRVGELVHLKGYAYDPEDGSSVNMSWMSSIDGALGIGDQLPLTNLSIGEHEITLIAEDSDGNMASKTVTIYIDGERPKIDLDVSINGTSTSCVANIEIYASDPIGGTGLDIVEYSLDGGTTWVGINPSTLPLNFSVSNKGFFHLIVQATDEASNLAVTDERFFLEASCPQEQLVFMPVILKQP